MILVTGGAGFIGSNLVAALEKSGSDVVICDRLGSGEKWRNVAKRRNVAGIVDPDRLLEWLEGRKLDTVFHLGAISDTLCRDADEMVRSNVEFSDDLVEWCCRASTPFVYASSAATYGRGPFSDQDPVENLSPLGLYGWSKHLFDLQVERRRRSGRTPPTCVGLKFFNVFGPHEYHKGKMASVPWQASQMKQETEGTFSVLGTSDSVEIRIGKIFPLFETIHGVEPARDFVSVDDAVRVLIWASGDRISGLYNVGTGVPTTFADMVTAIGCSASQRRQISDELLRTYQLVTCADLSKLRAAGYDSPFERATNVARRYRETYEAEDKYL